MVILAGGTTVCAREPDAPRVCVLPVRGSDLEAIRLERPGDAHLGWASLILSEHVNMLPDVPLPFLYPWFGGALYTITADNSLARFTGASDFSNPLVYSDGFGTALDGSTGRVVGINEGGLFTYDQEDASHATPAVLQLHRVAPSGPLFFFSVAYIERLSTMMVGTGKGVLRLRGDTLEALPGSDGREAGRIGPIVDLPVHGAVLLAGDEQIVLRHDDGSSEVFADLRGTNSRKYLKSVHESTRPGRIVLDMSDGELTEVTMVPTPSGYSSAGRQTLLSAGRDRSTDLVTPSGEFLFLGRIGWFSYGLRRLDGDGVHDVPGDMPWGALVFEDAVLWRTTLPGGALVRLPHGLYRYDGHRSVLVPDSSEDRVGRFIRVTAVPSVDLTVVQTERGLYVLEPSGRLRALEMPPGYDYNEVEVSELPAAHVGLISTGHALYTLDRAGMIRPIFGDTHDHYQTMQSFPGVIPRRDVMLVRGQEALHLIAAGVDCGGQASGRG